MRRTIRGGFPAGGGVVSAFDVHEAGLIWRGSVPSLGRSPNFLALSPNERVLVATHFLGIDGRGSASVFPLNEEGLPEPASHRIETTDDAAQRTHVHCARFEDAEGQRLLLADLGTDRLYRYALTPLAVTLKWRHSMQVLLRGREIL